MKGDAAGIIFKHLRVQNNKLTNDFIELLRVVCKLKCKHLKTSEVQFKNCKVNILLEDCVASL